MWSVAANPKIKVQNCNSDENLLTAIFQVIRNDALDFIGVHQRSSAVYY